MNEKSNNFIEKLQNYIMIKNDSIINRIGWTTYTPATYFPKKWYINKNHTAYFWSESLNMYGTNWSFDYILEHSNSVKKSYNLSQEEIDQIIKEIKDEQLTLPIFDGNLTYKVPIPEGIKYHNSPKPFEPNGNVCNHKMIPYTGLFETYNHCEKCGQKEK